MTALDAAIASLSPLKGVPQETTKRLHMPDLKYTVDKSILCAVCGHLITAGNQAYRHSADDPDAWRHVHHGPVPVPPSAGADPPPSIVLTAGDSDNPIRALNTHGQTGSEANSADTLGPANMEAVAKHVGAIRQEAERPAVSRVDESETAAVPIALIREAIAGMNGPAFSRCGGAAWELKLTAERLALYLPKKSLPQPLVIAGADPPHLGRLAKELTQLAIDDSIPDGQRRWRIKLIAERLALLADPPPAPGSDSVEELERRIRLLGFEIAEAQQELSRQRRHTDE